jgi:hypothetical protein
MLFYRMLGALRLDAGTFEEIERDPEATNQAFMVVVLAGVAGGVSQIRENSTAVAAGMTSNLAGWSLFALLAWVIGTRLFGTAETAATWSELARTCGFAYTPTLLNALGFIPGVGMPASVVGTLWFAAAAIVAMRQALDFTTGRAIATGLVCLAAQLAVTAIAFGALGTALPWAQ